MDPTNLDTASQYINNQLLSRGLLRHGKTINFAHPHGDDNNIDETMSRIMVVIHDLILRRDRDASQRENLTNSIRALRTDSQRLGTEVERLKEGKSEVARKLAIIEGERSLWEDKLKNKEDKERTLQVDIKKLKSAVDQANTKCAVECRKREVIIESLKKAVAGNRRARGSTKDFGIHKVDVRTGTGATRNTTTSKSIDAQDYDLHSESKDFLAELAKGLSEDNEHLAGLLRRTLDTLKALLGWNRPQESMIDETGIENFSNELEFAVEHIRKLLTNPSFVPLEEVEVREEEILRLRKGWEEMEQRWKEAVSMMESWRKRTMHDSEIIDPARRILDIRVKSSDSSTYKSSPHKLSTVREEVTAECDIGASFEVKDKPNVPDTIFEPDLGEDELGSNFSFSDGKFLDELSDNRSEPGSKFFEERVVNFNTALSTSCAGSHITPLCEVNGNRSSGRPFSMVQQSESSMITKENKLSSNNLDVPSKPKVLSSYSKLEPTLFSEIFSDQPCILDDNTVDTSSSPAVSHTSKKRILKSASKVASRCTVTDPRSTLRAKSLVEKTPASQHRSNRPKSSKRNEFKSEAQCVRKLASYKPSTATPKLKLGPDHRLPQPCEISLQQSPLTVTSIAAKLAANQRDANAARIRAKIQAARSSKNLTSPTKKHSHAGRENSTENSSDQSPVSKFHRARLQNDNHTHPISLGDKYPQERTGLIAENKTTSVNEERTRKRKERSPIRESPLKLIRGVR